MSKLTNLDKVAFVLLIIGGLNWGFTALGWNVVDSFGDPLSRLIYIIVGLAAVYVIVMFPRFHRK